MQCFVNDCLNVRIIAVYVMLHCPDHTETNDKHMVHGVHVGEMYMQLKKPIDVSIFHQLYRFYMKIHLQVSVKNYLSTW